MASPPYDVVSRAEAARLAEGNPWSFLHVVRSDIDLPDEVAPHDERVYARARESFERMLGEGTLVRDSSPRLYLYRLVMDGRAQLGVVGCVSVDDYGDGLIRRHEGTRPDKEDDRTRHIEALRAHAEPVLLAYRDRPRIDRLAAAGAQAAPLYDFTAEDGVRHTVWALTDAAAAACVDDFSSAACVYIADGHHRSASAWRAAGRPLAGPPVGRSGGERDWFPAALFPASQLRILPYNRLITDLSDQTPDEVLGQLGQLGRLSTTRDPAPPGPGSFCFYLGRRWYRLELEAASIDRADVLRSLDVALLQERVLGPVLGIVDQRTDKRIDFVGGGRGVRALEARVDAGDAAMAVSMFPTGMEQLLAVSDAGHSMPPKSTWFEPKLASGLIVHTW